MLMMAKTSTKYRIESSYSQGITQVGQSIFCCLCLNTIFDALRVTSLQKLVPNQLAQALGVCTCLCVTHLYLGCQSLFKHYSLVHRLLEFVQASGWLYILDPNRPMRALIQFGQQEPCMPFGHARLAYISPISFILAFYPNIFIFIHRILSRRLDRIIHRIH